MPQGDALLRDGDRSLRRQRHAAGQRIQLRNELGLLQRDVRTLQARGPLHFDDKPVQERGVRVFDRTAGMHRYDQQGAEHPLRRWTIVRKRAHHRGRRLQRERPVPDSASDRVRDRLLRLGGYQLSGLRRADGMRGRVLQLGSRLLQQRLYVAQRKRQLWRLRQQMHGWKELQRNAVRMARRSRLCERHRLRERRLRRALLPGWNVVRVHAALSCEPHTKSGFRHQYGRVDLGNWLGHRELALGGRCRCRRRPRRRRIVSLFRRGSFDLSARGR
jgi:hypothetical protein